MDTMPSVIHRRRPVRCPAEATLGVIAGQWKVLILYHLAGGKKRFSRLKEELIGINQKMLIQQLREMEADGVVRRKIYAQVPPKVEYSLTPRGKSLKPVVAAMCRWGKRRRR